MIIIFIIIINMDKAKADKDKDNMAFKIYYNLNYINPTV